MKSLLLVFIAAGFGVAFQDPQPSYEPQTVPPEPTDPFERVVRAKIGAQFSRGRNAKPLDEERNTPPPPGKKVNRLLLSPFPFAYSSVVVIGNVTKMQTFFSNDRTAIYGELSVRVDEILKNAKPVKVGDSLEIVSEGGSLILPDGRTVTWPVYGVGEPLRRDHRYVLFLDAYRGIPRFRIVAAWDLFEGRVLPTVVSCTPEETTSLTEHGQEVFLIRLRTAAQ